MDASRTDRGRLPLDEIFAGGVEKGLAYLGDPVPGVDVFAAIAVGAETRYERVLTSHTVLAAWFSAAEAKRPTNVRTSMIIPEEFRRR